MITQDCTCGVQPDRTLVVECAVCFRQRTVIPPQPGHRCTCGVQADGTFVAECHDCEAWRRERNAHAPHHTRRPMSLAGITSIRRARQRDAARKRRLR